MPDNYEFFDVPQAGVATKDTYEYFDVAGEAEQNDNYEYFDVTAPEVTNPIGRAIDMFGSGFYRGSAELLDTLDKTIKPVGEAVGVDASGLGWLSKKAEERSAYLAPTDPTMPERLISGVGSFAPGLVEWVAGVPYAAVKGGQEGYEKDGALGAVKGAVVGGGERYVLGRIFKAIEPLKLPARALSNGVIMASDTAMHGGSTQDIIDSFILGAGIALPGGKGKVGFKELVHDALNKHVPQKLDIPTRVFEPKGSEEILSAEVYPGEVNPEAKAQQANNLERYGLLDEFQKRYPQATVEDFDHIWETGTLPKQYAEDLIQKGGPGVEKGTFPLGQGERRVPEVKIEPTFDQLPYDQQLTRVLDKAHQEAANPEQARMLKEDLARKEQAGLPENKPFAELPYDEQMKRVLDTAHEEAKNPVVAEKYKEELRAGEEVKANGEPTVEAKKVLPEIPADTFQAKEVYRAIPADSSLVDASDHWYTDTPAVAEATKVSLEKSNPGREYRVIKLNADAVNKAGFKQVKKSPYEGVDGHWFETVKRIGPEHVLRNEQGMAVQVEAKTTTIMNEVAKKHGLPEVSAVAPELPTVPKEPQYRVVPAPGITSRRETIPSPADLASKTSSGKTKAPETQQSIKAEIQDWIKTAETQEEKSMFTKMRKDLENEELKNPRKNPDVEFLYGGPHPQMVIDGLKTIKDSVEGRFLSGLTRGDMSVLEAELSLPHWQGKNHPQFKKGVDRAEGMVKHGNTLSVQLVRKAEDFIFLPNGETRTVERAIIKGDRLGRVFTDEELSNLGLKTKKQIAAYHSVRRVLDEVWARRMDTVTDLITHSYKEQPWYKELKIMLGSDTPLREVDLKGLNMPEELKAAYVKSRMPLNKLDAARREMGNIQGFFPRERRTNVSRVINIYDAMGTKIYSEPIGSRVSDTVARVQVKHRMEQLQKEWPKYKVEEDFLKQTESWKGSPFGQFDHMLDIALEQVKKSGTGLDAKTLDRLHGEIIDSFVKEVQSRSNFSKHGLQRNKEVNILGYQEEGLKEVFTNYVRAYAKWEAKQYAIQDFHKILQGVDQKVQPRLYKETKQYIEDVLRSEAPIERIVGSAKGLAYTTYLAGTLRFPLVNLLQNPIMGFPELGKSTQMASLKYAKASVDTLPRAMARAFDTVTLHKFRETGKDLGNKRVSSEEAKALNQALDEGITQDNYMQEVYHQMEGTFGKTVNYVMRPLAALGSASERFNREQAFLASFRVARAEKKMSYDEAYKFADDFVKNVHFAFGKTNLPKLMRSEGTVGATARALYTFKTYDHNMLLWMKNSLSNNGYGAVMKSIMWMGLIGGLRALPGYKDIMNEAEKHLGKTWKRQVAMWAKQNGLVGEFVHNGLAGMTGSDISSSIGFNPVESNHSIAGIWGSLWDKGARTVEDINKQDYMRALEDGSPSFIANQFKASRLQKQGATSRTGKPMLGPDGKQFKYTDKEALMRRAGFTSIDEAKGFTAYQSEQNIKEYYTKRKKEIEFKYTKAKAAHDYEGVKAAREEAREYKEKVKAEGLTGMVPSVKFTTTYQRPSEQTRKYQKAF